MMKRLLTPFLKRFYGLAAFAALTYGALLAAQHTEWYKERLFAKLVTGDTEEATVAAFDLAWLNGERQLVRALQEPSPGVREIAERFLRDLYNKAEGRDACRRLMEAQDAMEAGRETEALASLDALIADHPRFAEAWNRRAILHWQAHRYAAAMNDVQKVVKLAPLHIGAWHGMAECAMSMGDYQTAKRALQVVLGIAPHSESAREMLEECEQVLNPRKPRFRAPRSTVTQV